MPESKVRKDAAAKQKAGAQQELAQKRADRRRLEAPRSTAWVPWAFITVGLLGVIWLVVYYIAGPSVPGMRSLGQWNVVIGMGLMAASFGIATLWK